MNLGENVHLEPNSQGKVDPSDPVNAWYIPTSNAYDYVDPNPNPEMLDFFQMVSKTTSSYGCGQAFKETAEEVKNVYTVCLYDPAYQFGDEVDKINPSVFDLTDGQLNAQIFGDKTLVGKLYTRNYSPILLEPNLSLVNHNFDD